MWAVILRNETVVQLLLATVKIVVESKDRYGETPLSKAAYLGCQAIVEMLLENNATLECKDAMGQTPLLWAARGGEHAVVKMLLDRGATLDKDVMGRTPLWWAARGGNVKHFLAPNHIDVDPKDCYNTTPLSIAARFGHKDAVLDLLARSPDLKIKDIFGRTPLWWARGYPEVADILIEYCKKNGIVVQEDNLPTPRDQGPYDDDSGFCVVCLFGVSDGDSFYCCGICINGDFVMCEDCFAIKAHCLDDSHILHKN